MYFFFGTPSFTSPLRVFYLVLTIFGVAVVSLVFLFFSSFFRIFFLLTPFVIVTRRPTDGWLVISRFFSHFFKKNQRKIWRPQHETKKLFFSKIFQSNSPISLVSLNRFVVRSLSFPVVAATWWLLMESHSAVAAVYRVLPSFFVHFYGNRFFLLMGQV